MSENRWAEDPQSANQAKANFWRAVALLHKLHLIDLDDIRLIHIPPEQVHPELPANFGPSDGFHRMFLVRSPVMLDVVGHALLGKDVSPDVSAIAVGILLQLAYMLGKADGGAAS